MKKFISVVLIVACLSLSACNKYNKDSINSAFYSNKSTERLLEKGKYIDYWDLNDELYDDDGNAYDDYEDIANKIVGDKFIYYYDEDTDSYAIMDVYGYYSSRLDFYDSSRIWKCFYCSINVVENPTYDVEQFEEWMMRFDETYDEFVETSEGVRINYGIEEIGDFARYDVMLTYQDTKTGNIVLITYYLPTEDNKEDIEELRDLGIPVITDFIE